MSLLRSTLAVALITALALPCHHAFAAVCSGDDIAKAVDSAGASLRQFNLEAAPKLQARLKALGAKKGWSDQDFEEQAVTYLQDARIAKFDETANTLLARIDTIGRQNPGQAADCAKLDEMRSSGIELMAVMKAKTGYLMDKVNAELGPEPAPATTAAAAPVPATPPPAHPDPAKAADTTAKANPTPPPRIPTRSAAPQPSPPPSLPLPPADSTTSWPATTAAVIPAPAPPAAPPVPSPPVEARDDVPRPVAPMVPPPPPPAESAEGYSIEEIRDATKGFFGSVSTGLATVIEHAFAKAGRPTGYVLGQEGGGAFLGGLRYGDGTLYNRAGGTQKIYWHGPSIGLDIGAAGTRTMFLVYKMREPGDLYRVFTGIDGSAFVVGGVGVTLLAGGDMILAPIRSGLGIRVGANIGYLRFTPEQTWNPF